MELYQEIIENEKGRLDLFKWKVVLVAGLGAAASGVVGAKPITPVLPLALIPLVCIYVDLLSLDLTLRICVITKYLNLAREEEQEPSDAGYAAFVAKADQMESAPGFFATLCSISRVVGDRLVGRDGTPSAYTFVFLAQGLSTSALAISVFFWGLFFLPGRDKWVLALSALIGIAATFYSYLEYKRRTLAIATLTVSP